jgi:8-oxo-dGTP pyrophosphatase MutT (NUDIX family)
MIHLTGANVGRIVQAGAIGFKRCANQWCFLLVSARQDPSSWIFPKGHVEPGESLEEAALRELREEAGVQGEVDRPVGTLTFRSGEEEVRVNYFLIRAHSERQGEEARRVRWLPLRDALALLTFHDAKDLLQEAAEHLEEP